MLIPQDRTEVREMLLRGAGTIWSVEAAMILLGDSETLLDRLLDSFLVIYDSRWPRTLSVDFDRAFSALEDGSLSLSESDFGKFLIVASLAGKRMVYLRECLNNLGIDGMSQVAKAIMYAGGFLDGDADPIANQPNGVDSDGPNMIAHLRRIGDV